MSEKKAAQKSADRPLKIAMLGHKRIPGREGGVEVVVEELATRMVEQGHQVTCFNRSGHHVSGKEFDTAHGTNYRGVRLKNVPTLDRRGLAAISASVTGAFLAAFGTYDVVHFHAEGPAFMCWLPKLTGKKVVVTIHGLDHQRTKWGRLAKWYLMLGEKHAARFADEIIVLSKGVQDYFWDTYHRKTVLIPNGVNRPQIRQADWITQRFGLEKDSYLLFLGRLVPEKGISNLMKGFQRVHTNKKLVIAGGSSDTEAFVRQLKELAAGQDQIVFTGFVAGRWLEELYSNCYLYCLPSDLEGMPLSLLEAMSYGNCCVVSDIPECADVVEDRGVVVPRGNVEELAQALQRLCDAPDVVEHYRKGAAEFICQKYNWDEVTAQTLSLYQGRVRREDFDD